MYKMGERGRDRKDGDTSFGDLKAAVHASIQDPEGTPDNLSIIELSPEVSFKVLTNKRLQIFRTLKHNPGISSIKGLSERVGRRPEVVSRDLKILINYGLVDLEEDGRTKVPKVINGSDGILVRID